MSLVFALIGGLFGLVVAATNASSLGLIGGALIGVLFGQWLAMRNRLARLEAHLRQIAVADRARAGKAVPIAESAATPGPVPAPAPAPPAAPPPPLPSAAVFWKRSEEGREAAQDMALAAAARSQANPTAAIEIAPGSPPPPAASSPSGPQAAGFWRWFGEGNWVARIGLVLLFIGVGALYRYAAAQGWLNFPIEYRFIAVAVAGIAALAFGFRQRQRRPVFALSLQGAAIGLLMLTVFSAYRLYHLLPASLCFALLIGLTAGCALLAIAQNSLGLAVFGIIGGFAAPILAASGSGNHVALFSYYLLLNLAILAISWARGWRVLNLLGFLSTFVVATIWGVLRYRPALFDSTEPFLIAFYLLYLLIPLLPALRPTDPTERDHVHGSLVFGTPLVGFGLQASLLADDRYGLAWSALALALAYALLARLVWRHAGLGRWRQAYTGLALVFATLAMPLALSARWTSASWAIEGALLVWLGLVQAERRLRWMGLLLQLLAGGALLLFGFERGHGGSGHAFGFGALLLAMSGLASGWYYQRLAPAVRWPRSLAVWAFFWWIAAGLTEIDRHVSGSREVDAALVLFGLSAALAAWLRRVLDYPPFAWLGLAGLLSALPMVVAMGFEHHSPLGESGWRAWLVYTLASVATLAVLAKPWARGLASSHALWWLAFPLLASWELNQWVLQQSGLGQGWRVAALALPWLAACAVLWQGFAPAAFPLYRQISALRSRLLLVLGAVAGLIALAALFLPGGSAPLPWLPLFNPLELTQIAALLLFWRSLADFDRGGSLAAPMRTLVLAFGFAALSMATLRAAHHYAAEPWSPTLFSHALPQAALAIVWTLTGIVGMLAGAARRRRPLWIAGASVLGLVLAKLLLIDLHFLGDLWGIVSLLGVGVLFVAVGFFAPMPPAACADASN